MDLNHPSQPQLVEAGQEALVRGAWEEARSTFERALHTGNRDAAKHSFRTVVDPDGSAEVLSGLAEALWWLGEIREAFDCWERAYSAFHQRPDPAQAAFVAIQLSILYDANLGNHAAAAGWVARAARLVEENELEPLRGWVLVAKAYISDDPGRQEALAREAHRLGRASSDRDLELCALTEIGVALIDQGRVTEGMAFHDEAVAGALAELGGTLDCQVMLACGERLRGRALATASDAAAKRHLDAALREFIRLEMPFEAARTRLLLAQVVSEDDPEVAEAEARAALAAFEDLGAVADAEATTTVLQEIESIARNRTDKTSDPAGLSQRETQVLRLVAQGLSDREIAARLVLSRHTIHRHISNILTKLDLPSRTAAAAYAARHGLL